MLKSYWIIIHVNYFNMGAAVCPNCNICTCTGTYFVKANNGKQCCTACVNAVNQQIADEQAANEQIKK
jgi:hypothetical protein